MRLCAPYRSRLFVPRLLPLPSSAQYSRHNSVRQHVSNTMPSSKAAHDFLTFVNASPSPYHAVQGVRERLETAGFEKILESEDWSSKCRPGGKYFLTRNASTIVAFAIGAKWTPGNPVAMIGAHTDSPCLRIKVSLLKLYL